MRTSLQTRPALLAALICCPALAQQIQLGDALPGASSTHRQRVEQATAEIHVKRNEPDWIELRFRIDPGVHINSHAPKDELLKPTTLEIAAADSVKVIREEYPGGVPLRLDIGSGELLSTYQGEFAVRLQLLASKSATTLTGALHYQACDARSCFPPRTLPVSVNLSPR